MISDTIFFILISLELFVIFLTLYHIWKIEEHIKKMESHIDLLNIFIKQSEKEIRKEVNKNGKKIN